MLEPRLRYQEYSLRLRELAVLGGAITGTIETVQRLLRHQGGSEVLRDLTNCGINFARRTTWSRLPSEVLGAVSAPLRRLQGATYGSTRLIQNLFLVVICTQFEIFVKHLIDVVLTNDPRLLKSLASRKTITGADAVESHDYATIMRILREKVVKEVIDVGPREMLLEHLGNRFKLFTESDLEVSPNLGEAVQPPRGWSVEQFEETITVRNCIVHEGALPVEDSRYLNDVIWFLDHIQTILAINAVVEYGVSLDSPQSLGYLIAMGTFYALPEHKLRAVKEKEKTSGN